jgi:hypothetical protein
MHMAVELGSKQFWERLNNDPQKLAAEICLIDVTHLERTMQQQASLRAWVNAAHETARIAEARAEFEVTKASARALLRAKGEKDPDTTKAKTGEVLKAEAAVDPDYLLKMEDYLSAQQQRGALRAMTVALEDRLQMLIQISANQRKEQASY